jgi:DNA-binding FrmR family transcriptional regulator
MSPSTTPTRGYSASKDQLLGRLRRIEGQVRGIQGMVLDERYCIDVLTQISAAQSALRSVAVGLLDQHLHHCVQGAAREDAEGAGALVDEATRAIERLLRT